MLLNAKEMLTDAQKGHYAVGAFNIENMEMLQGVLSAAEAEHAPVILQTTPGTLRYADAALFAALAHAAAEKATAPVALHLDHGSSYDLCVYAAKCGYTSLMIDGSKLPFEDNVALSAQVARLKITYSQVGCVEAELGKLGGKEDDVSGDGDCYTDPEHAATFARLTGVDSLAVAIGTAHGFYKATPKLDFDRLREIRAAVDIPLVLHGSSGIPDSDVQQAIGLGICKVNFATELRAAYTKAVCSTLQADSQIYDPKKYGEAGREAVCEIVRHRIKVCCG